MLFIICLVVFIVVMLLWFLGNNGTIPADRGGNWLGFVAVLVLGIVVFLVASGNIVMDGRAVR